jgi:prepilin-type N-terminal cleavage/methylation domain-containing protein
MSRTISPSQGFTLLELIITISIIVFLMSMFMPLMNLAKRASLRTVSLSTMAKTEASLYQYKTDFKAYPYQLSYSQDGDPWSNALNYNVGTDIAIADQTAVKADMQAAAAQYAFNMNNGYQAMTQQSFTMNRGNGALYGDGSNSPEGDPAPSGASYNSGNQVWTWTYSGGCMQLCMMLNRLGAERANEMLLVGDVTGCGVNMLPETGPGGLTHHGRDLSQMRLVNTPQSAERPGWARDYLQGEIDAKYLQGPNILDGYLHPLIYICQVIPGVEVTWGNMYNNYVDIGNPAIYGLTPIGRSTLQPFIPGTSTPITGNPASLPDVTNLMHSDLRYWAAPGLELEFELWSAGPDGQMGWWRDDLANRDNIPCEHYNQRIGAQP